ncbi:alpha/beta hydrolase [Amycolatopsis panacis]|uniref:Alpha/beta hydrolase n=1 Tax=Amycolatopsis panacis TaxID=2340917 RepID=A0A419I8X0_9PSEU|nr:alpha/beta hydrolase [Amycolatopsis panacis]
MRRTVLFAALGAMTATTLLAPNAGATGGPRWGACPADVRSPTLQCATLQVPLDYRDPGGRKIGLTISRLASTNPEKRRGVLLTNPGGPGGPGLDMPGMLTMPGLPGTLPQNVRDTYDVIGIDPRGVGHSSPVTCDLTKAQLELSNMPYANTPADVVKQAKVAKEEAKQCASSKSAWMLPYVTTANTARDLDQVRKALGEEKISYLGVSYGTYLGAVYTTMFPQRSDRFVLDSNLGSGGYDIEAMHGFARGMQDRFPDFAKYAAAHPEFGLGTKQAQVTAKFFALAARLDRNPIGGIDGSIFRTLTFEHIYLDAQFPQLAKAWQSLDRGVAPVSGLMKYPENLLATRLHVMCGDSSWPRSVGSYQADVAVSRGEYPMIGAGAANIGPCAYWAPPKEPKVRISDRGPSNVLMVQNLRDPATPLSGARDLRRAFGQRARMVTVDQGGHGAYAFAANQCATAVVNDYLATGKRIGQDRFCAAESR